MATAKYAFADTFAELRGILKPYSGELLVTVDKPGEFTLASRTATDRIGRPLFAASVRVGKSYVSYHLMGVYAAPELLKGISPDLRKRMQGKSCFNFKTPDEKLFKELGKLTKAGFEKFHDAEFLQKILSR